MSKVKKGNGPKKVGKNEKCLELFQDPNTCFTLGLEWCILQQQRQNDKQIKRELNIEMSGQFRTLAISNQQFSWYSGGLEMLEMLNF